MMMPDPPKIDEFRIALRVFCREQQLITPMRLSDMAGVLEDQADFLRNVEAELDKVDGRINVTCDP